MKRPKRTRPVTPAATYDSLPEMVTPEEAFAFLRISRNAGYEALRNNEIPHVKMGRLFRIYKPVLIGGQTS